jgi:hypothetical protein
MVGRVREETHQLKEAEMGSWLPSGKAVGGGFTANFPMITKQIVRNLA